MMKEIIKKLNDYKLEHELPNENNGNFNYGYVKAINDAINLINKYSIFDKGQISLDIADIITPFWLWLVREAKIEVIDAETAIEVYGFAKEEDNLIPVVTFAELLELYKSQKNL